MRAHDGGIEHLNEMRGRTHRGGRIEEGLEHTCLAQAVEPFPDAVPLAEPVRQGAPSHVFDGEEMKRFKEPAIILALSSASGKAGPKHRERMRPMSSFIRIDMASGLRPNRSPMNHA